MKISVAITLLLLNAVFVLSSHASQTFIVYDVNGEKLSNIIIEVSAKGAESSETLAGQRAAAPTLSPETFPEPKLMQQKGQQFTPHILLVSAGQRVVFPNADDVVHHVYSFSPAKAFEVTIEQNITSEPITFDQAGIVELGCNVHDWMLGYIYVSSAQQAGQTQPNGELSIELSLGEYNVSLWHPRLSEQDIAKTFSISVSSASDVHELRLTHPLYPSLTGYDNVEVSDAY